MSRKEMTYSEKVAIELREHREKALHDEATRLFEAREEGMAEGMEKGREEGKIEAARKLLKEGMKRTDIARILELKEEDF